MSIINQDRKDVSFAWQLCLAFALAAAALMLPDFAHASGDTPIGNLFCTFSSWMTGNTGRGLATIAITIIGIGALLGKVSWGMALIVSIGVALVFGASGIIDAISSLSGFGSIESTCNVAGTFSAPPAAP